MPVISETTKESYKMFENVLSNVLSNVDWSKLKSSERANILKDYKTVIKAFKTYTIKDSHGKDTGKHYQKSTLRNYFTKLHVLIMKHPRWELIEADKAYVEEMNILNKELTEQAGENEKTATQLKNWVDWELVLKLRDELKKDISTSSDATKWKAYQKWMLLSLYVLRPPVRMDYQDMRIISHVEPKLSSDYNYIAMKDKVFVFNQYKTSKFHKKKNKKYTRSTEILQNTKPIPDELFNIIKIWIKDYKPNTTSFDKDGNLYNVLLVQSDGSPLCGPALTKMITRLFTDRDYPGASVDILRHSYIVHEFDAGHLDTTNKQKQLASDMMHSVLMQSEYYKKPSK
jgi:hypothetical protein